MAIHLASKLALAAWSCSGLPKRTASEKTLGKSHVEVPVPMFLSVVLCPGRRINGPSDGIARADEDRAPPPEAPLQKQFTCALIAIVPGVPQVPAPLSACRF